mmetsp:Transcript_19305/g.29740  ORF Transcript_19305/g.29740 Transcript_19305/m.29740 type:complete len:216 (-) Transcript_19305:794-1441(-)
MTPVTMRQDPNMIELRAEERQVPILSTSHLIQLAANTTINRRRVNLLQINLERIPARILAAKRLLPKLKRKVMLSAKRLRNHLVLSSQRRLPAKEAILLTASHPVPRKCPKLSARRSNDASQRVLITSFLPVALPFSMTMTRKAGAYHLKENRLLMERHTQTIRPVKRCHRRLIHLLNQPRRLLHLQLLQRLVLRQALLRSSQRLKPLPSNTGVL